MLRDIQWLDTETCLAVGPAYDLEKVISTMREILRVFLARSRMRQPEESERLYWSAGRGLMASGEEYADVMEEAMTGIIRYYAAEHHTTGDFTAIVRHGRLAAAMRPLGIETLIRLRNGTVLTEGRREPERLDTRPSMLFFRPTAADFGLDPADLRLITSAVASFGNRGVVVPLDDKGVITQPAILRFPHEAFGAGEGRLRVRCVDC